MIHELPTLSLRWYTEWKYVFLASTSMYFYYYYYYLSLRIDVLIVIITVTSNKLTASACKLTLTFKCNHGTNVLIVLIPNTKLLSGRSVT